MKSVGVKLVSFSVVCLVVLLMFGGVAWGKELRYTKYNIHAQYKSAKVVRASYANYTNPGSGHVIIPAGTAVTVKDKSRRRIVFAYDGGEKEIVFEYHAPRMQMSVDEYLEKITSPTPVSLDHFSALDKKGISQGKALVGMSREGVMTALGYPATHRTPSLDATTWIYWTNRFRTMAVEFGPDGKVVAVRN